ncbi:ATPase AAA-2 domain protein [Syntrophobotulus glycolicus DSM 8271]|uniref:ATPase AAA-2 domain protein n=1 Tax=Syntrophobotulus glycolicus (strain DSM 8271 / FlGlyR) TaxID=645991 RepID=F0SWX3_SYNGF|nr:ATP-dependent Clp protease ATP-binding subunit [Syntrophobotulus glycolicus]ADY54663.1 ATPase AAA-2 domain protein [Syntrophobotulus glycolicus DSM 8271]
MPGRFTQKAEQVFLLAESTAKRMGHKTIGTEHILLALLEEGEGVAATALKEMGLDEEKMSGKIIQLIGISEPIAGEVGLSPRVKRVIEIATEEAQRQGVNYVGTEHVLLGILIEGEGIAARVLADLKVNPEKLWEHVVALLGGEAENTSVPGSSPGMTGGKNVSSNTPALNEFGRDLTVMAQEKKLDPVIGREKEIERVIQVLSRRTKNNPVLIGEPGVGKTAIAEGLAQRIVSGGVPEILADKRVVTLDLSSMVAGTKYRGEFEERMKKVMEEIRFAGNIIIFIDELHTLIGAGAAEGAIDAANILKPALARGEMQCVGATTLDEYRKYIERDSALERRFQPIKIGEPTVEEAIEILKGLRDRYEAHHRVKITDEAIEAAVRLSDRYISDRFLPDKAIDLMDEAASKVRLSSYTAPGELKELETEVEALKKEKEAAVKRQEFEQAAKIRDQEQQKREQLSTLRKDWEANREKNLSILNQEDIGKIVSSWTGIPVNKLEEEESARLLKLEEVLHERVVGQEEAVSAVARSVRRARAGLKDPKRPIGSFIFLGPTGVGKTELARALAEALFGDENSLIRVDMSEYMEKHAVSRMVGSPPGYVGHDEGGQLTEAVRRKPYSVLLFDEIEKAHPEVFNILLQVLEDGRLTDSKGRVVDFRNCVLMMTSNVGASFLRKEAMGFMSSHSEDSEYRNMSANVMEELKKVFKPEFLNRIDEIVVFHQLKDEELQKIAAILLASLGKRLQQQNYTIIADEKAMQLVAKEGNDPAFGARPLRRAIQRLIEDPLSERILQEQFKPGDTIYVSAENNTMIFSSEKQLSESGESKKPAKPQKKVKAKTKKDEI